MKLSKQGLWTVKVTKKNYRISKKNQKKIIYFLQAETKFYNGLLYYGEGGKP